MLSVESGVGVASRDFRFSNRGGLFRNSDSPAPFRSQKARSSIQLDVRVIRRIHRRVRVHPSDGGVEPLARELLVGGCNQGGHRCGVGAHGDIARPSYAAGARSSQLWPVDQGQRGAQRGNCGTPRGGTRPSHQRGQLSRAGRTTGSDARRHLCAQPRRKNLLLESRRGAALPMAKGGSSRQIKPRASADAVSCSRWAS